MGTERAGVKHTGLEVCYAVRWLVPLLLQSRVQSKRKCLALFCFALNRTHIEKSAWKSQKKIANTIKNSTKAMKTYELYTNPMFTQKRFYCFCFFFLFGFLCFFEPRKAPPWIPPLGCSRIPSVWVLPNSFRLDAPEFLPLGCSRIPSAWVLVFFVNLEHANLVQFSCSC